MTFHSCPPKESPVNSLDLQWALMFIQFSCMHASAYYTLCAISLHLLVSWGCWKCSFLRAANDRASWQLISPLVCSTVCWIATEMSLLIAAFGKFLGSQRVAWNLLAEGGGEVQLRTTRGLLAAVSPGLRRPRTSEATADKNAKEEDETGTTSRACLRIAAYMHDRGGVAQAEKTCFRWLKRIKKTKKKLLKPTL